MVEAVQDRLRVVVALAVRIEVCKPSWHTVGEGLHLDILGALAWQVHDTLLASHCRTAKCRELLLHRIFILTEVLCYAEELTRLLILDSCLTY